MKANVNITDKSKQLPFRRLFTLLLVPMVLQACATSESNLPVSSPALRDAKNISEVTLPEQIIVEEPRDSVIMQRPPRESKYRFTGADIFNLPDNLPDKQFVAGYNNMPVKAFINEVFGNQLALSFSIDSDVQDLVELVSLRLIEKVDSARLFNIASQTLASYGVSISEQQGLYVFSYSENATASSVPLVVSGAALPDVPASHRPLFLHLPLKVVSYVAIYPLLLEAMRGQDVIIQQLPMENAILLQGQREAVEQTLAIMRVLDQPSSSGKFSVLLKPVSGTNSNLATDLANLLNSEGYSASTGSDGVINIFPLKSSNGLIILSRDRGALERSVEWFHTIDSKRQSDIKDGFFTYKVRSTDAKGIVELLNELSSPGGAPSEGPAIVGEPPATASGQYIADENRNSILFKGSGKRWLEVLPTLRDMDSPTPSVLVEVILAELTIGDSLKSGVELIGRAGEATYSTIGGLGVGGTGLVATLNRGGETRAALNAFYSDSRANILSRPRLMVKNGESASIDVGNEIPTITSSERSTDNSGAPVISTVKYRKTGIRLTITPTIHSSGYVEINISQELSEASLNVTSSIDSPSIFNRSLQTTVTLKDGGSVLLGGLISESRSTGNSGIPILGELPLLGRLFRTDTKSTGRTELVLMVVPYIIDNPEDAETISDSALEFYEMTL